MDSSSTSSRHLVVFYSTYSFYVLTYVDCIVAMGPDFVNKTIIIFDDVPQL
jgi:hypothetical protein